MLRHFMRIERHVRLVAKQEIELRLRVHLNVLLDLVHKNLHIKTQVHFLRPSA